MHEPVCGFGIGLRSEHYRDFIATPQRVDVYFDNVGGPVLDAVLKRLAHQGRVVLCGAIAVYKAMERWPLVRSRVLALTAEREALRAGHPTAVSLLQDVREHCFPGSHPLMNPARAAEYAGVIAAFLKE